MTIYGITVYRKKSIFRRKYYTSKEKALKELIDVYLSVDKQEVPNRELYVTDGICEVRAGEIFAYVESLEVIE